MSAKQSKAPAVRVINREDPINSLSTEERAVAKSLGLTGEKVDRRLIKKALPKRWREIVYAVCSRPHSQAQLAGALGISLRTLQKRIADPADPLTDAIETAKSVMYAVVIDPMYQRLLEDKSEETFGLRQWFAARLWPADFNPNVQSNQRPAVQVNVQTNVAQLPRAMTPSEYAKLFVDPKVIDAKSDQVPAGDARNA